MGTKEIKIVHEEIPVTIFINGNVYQQADGKGGVLPSYHFQIDRDGSNMVSIAINNTQDLDDLIDKLLDHRKLITK